jgi:hypothetical protein
MGSPLLVVNRAFRTLCKRCDGVKFNYLDGVAFESAAAHGVEVTKRRPWSGAEDNFTNNGVAREGFEPSTFGL